VERNEAKALRNVTAVKTGEGAFIDEYTDKQNCDRISWASLGHYLTYPSILRNRCGCGLRGEQQLLTLNPVRLPLILAAVVWGAPLLAWGAVALPGPQRVCHGPAWHLHGSGHPRGVSRDWDVHLLLVSGSIS